MPDIRPRRRTALWLSVVAAAAVGAVAITAAPAQAALRDPATTANRFIGFAANAGLLCNNSSTCTSGTDTTYRTLGASEFSQLTPENVMKWDSIEPSNNQYNFGPADGLVAFAQANNQQVHGHTLVWHSQTPGYVQSLGATAMRAEMQEHINAVIGRYASNPAVVSWDVVNEVIDDSGSGLRSSFWLNTLGDGFIADAFRFARAADPDADLCINDYGIEGQNAKSNRLFTLVQSLLQQNVPVTCVGFQAHLVINQIPSDFQANMQRFANLGLKVRISELDIRIPLPADAQELQTQASNYATVVNACRAVSACQGITLWGIDDGHSWLPNSCCGGGNEAAALLWNSSYQQKPAYAAVNTAFGGGGTQVPGVPGAPVASGVTSSGVTLSWSASSGTVSSYQVERATGAGSTAFTQVGSPATASFTDSGLAASTTYRYRVRATNSAGASAYSAITNVTTSAGGGGTGGCTATFANTNQWPGGFQGEVTVTNTGSSTTTGWTVTLTFTAGQQISQLWNGSLTGSGPYTVTNLSYNGTIAPNTSTSFGFLGSWSGTNAAPSVSCTRTP